MTSPVHQRPVSGKKPGLQPYDTAMIARLHGHARKELLTSSLWLLALVLLVPIFLGTLVFDYTLVHEALATRLAGTGQNARVLAGTFVVAVAAIHFLIEGSGTDDTDSDKSRVKASWLLHATRRAVLMYVIGFGALLAYTTLQFATGDIMLPVFGDDTWDVQVSQFAKDVLRVLIAVAEPLVIGLVGLAMAGLFIMSVFVGQASLSCLLHIAGRFLQARAVFAQSKAAKKAVDEANARLGAATREAQRLSAIPQAQIVREAMVEIITVRNAALAEPRALLLKAALSASEAGLAESGVIEVPGLSETQGIEAVNLAALREMVAEIDAATSSKALEAAAHALLNDEPQKDDSHG